MKVGVYPGSFDPLTLGHLDIIHRALALVDKVVIAVIGNPDKKPLLSDQERVQLIEQCTQEFGNRVEVKEFDGLLVDFVKSQNCHIIIRGLRAFSDFEYEFSMALTNRHLAADVETIFLMTDYKNSYISSHTVKQIASLGGDFTKMVPTPVAQVLKKKFAS